MPDEIHIAKIESVVLDAAVPIILIIAGALLVLRFARPFMRRLLHQALESRTFSAPASRLTAAEVQKRVDTIEKLGVSAIRLVVFVLVGALVLAVLNLGWVVGALGLVLAALAFAGQDFVRDYLAGVFILFENQFYVGDVIRVAGVTGTVEEFTLRRTALRDGDGTLHMVSNGEFRVASNLTRGYAGINLDVPIGYDADVDRVMALIDEAGAALAADPAWARRILEAPAAVRVDAFGDIGMSIKVIGKVGAGEQWAATGELRRRVLAAFADAGISLPHRNVIFERWDTASMKSPGSDARS